MNKEAASLPSYFGTFGGRFVPEMLIPALDELTAAYVEAKADPQFQVQLDELLVNYAGRSTPLHYAENLTKRLGGAKIYLKLECVTHTGSHKINNVLGQALLAKRMGKTHLIAETGAGQHGLASATAAARFKMACRVFMGEVDIRRQYPNVYGMRLLGAEVISVTEGTKTLKDAVNAALKYWIEHLTDTHYLLGSALGPHPYPTMVRDFQSVIGREVKNQIFEREGRLPDVLVACVGGGSNAIGLFHPFIEESSVRCVGVEAGGRGLAIGDHAARLRTTPSAGIAQGYRSYFLLDDEGQLQPTHSISAGLDYAGIGPEHAYLFETGRVDYVSVTDDEVLSAYQLLSQEEGVIPALESSHAVAHAIKRAPQMDCSEIMVVNISGRGDKDLFITAPLIDHERWKAFLSHELELL